MDTTQGRYVIDTEPTPPGSVRPLRYVVVDTKDGERYFAGFAEHEAKQLIRILKIADERYGT